MNTYGFILAHHGYAEAERYAEEMENESTEEAETNAVWGAMEKGFSESWETRERPKFEEYAKRRGYLLDRYMGSGEYLDSEAAAAWAVWGRACQ